MEQEYKYMVRVSCMTYNHAPYVVDAMNGFTMQETNFPFVCTIIDDASTDGEPEIIRKYLHDNFDLEDKNVVRNEETDDYLLCFARHKTNQNCFFAVLWLKYNHYSIKKPKLPYIPEWNDNAKYIALCEGDDYWIDSRKLQKQIAFLEAHLDYTMTCNRTELFSVRKQKIVGVNYCYNQNQEVDAKDVIYRTGLFISTCSIVYRKTVVDNKPDYWRDCKVGDYPLQIACSMRGKVFYFNDIMSVYRVENSNSWMGSHGWGTISPNRLAVIRSQIDMFKGFAHDYPHYKKLFYNKIANQINRNVPSRAFPLRDVQLYLDSFSEEIKNYSVRWKFDLWVRKTRLPKVAALYNVFFMHEYNEKNLMYT